MRSMMTRRPHLTSGLKRIEWATKSTEVHRRNTMWIYLISRLVVWMTWSCLRRSTISSGSKTEDRRRKTWWSIWRSRETPRIRILWSIWKSCHLTLLWDLPPMMREWTYIPKILIRFSFNRVQVIQREHNLSLRKLIWKWIIYNPLASKHQRA